MNYWLVKTEPETFSWEELIHKGYSMWDGVRNFQARNNLRKMKVGDLLLFYYSGKNPGITAIAEVTREYYPDPTADEDHWSVVDVKPVRPLERFLCLKELKQVPDLKDMVLVRNTRLSVQPVKEEEYQKILELEKQHELV